jgi:hypothetical protein
MNAVAAQVAVLWQKTGRLTSHRPMSYPDSLPCPPRRTVPASSQRPRTEPRFPLGDFLPSEPRYPCRQPADCGSTHRRWPRASRAWDLARPALDAAAERAERSQRRSWRTPRVRDRTQWRSGRRSFPGRGPSRVEVRRQSRAESAGNGPSGAVDAVAVRNSRSHFGFADGKVLSIRVLEAAFVCRARSRRIVSTRSWCLRVRLVLSVA